MEVMWEKEEMELKVDGFMCGNLPELVGICPGADICTGFMYCSVLSDVFESCLRRLWIIVSRQHRMTRV